MTNKMIVPHSALLLIGCLIAAADTLQAQVQSLTLPESQALATENYPLVKRYDLIARSTAYAVEQASNGYLPQINILGQATYQSAVTEIPFQVPGIDVPRLDRDQYKLYGEVSQSLYDGGRTRVQKAALEADARTDQHALEVELYKIKERVNQLFFGILLVDAQLAQNELLKNDIQAGLGKTNAAIVHGAALKSSGSLLEAELLNADQRTAELMATRKAYLHMLGLFTGKELDEHTVLKKPAGLNPSSAIRRPELDWYEQQQHGIDVARKGLAAKNRPKVGLFVQAGVGRPALNMLSNDFDMYYYGGIRLTVPISGFYTLKKEKAILDISEAAIEVHRETFLFNTDLSLRQQSTELAKYEQLLETDDEIIALRESVKDAALAQLENGVINTADYMREVHAADGARLAKIRHELQLLKAQYDVQYTTGN